jgi:ABC-type lipoprotein release transport system permease subunit
MKHREKNKGILMVLVLTLTFLTIPVETNFTGQHNSHGKQAAVSTGLIMDAAASPAVSMHIKVVNALTGEAIPNATLIILDLRNPRKPRVGEGIYFTNAEGEYNAPEELLKTGRTYWIYAYKGSLSEKKMEFVPVKKEVHIEEAGSIDMDLPLVPGALVELESIPYIVQASSLQEGNMIIRVILKQKDFNFSFITEYGDAIDVFYLGLDRKMIPVPSDVSFDLEVSISLVLREREWVSEIFYIRNGTQPFMMRQGGYASVRISEYSLRRGLEYVKSALVEVSSMVDEAQEIGFTVFEERRMLQHANQKLVEANTLLSNAQTEEDFEKIWFTLREILGEINFVSTTIGNKYLVGKTNAVYLSAVIVIFSTVLAFFFFERPRKKVFSLAIIYVALLGIMYFINPGTHVVIDENLTLFSSTAVVSFAVTSIIVFGIPRIWKERNIEGEVQWRSALSVIFSMSKRQIKRKKMRGFFTIFSVCMLILAFTALTTFGTAFGIISKRVEDVPSSDGFLIKRMVNGSSFIFSPLGSGDIEVLQKITPAVDATLRMKNIPRYDPVVRLINPFTGSSYPIYGVLAISPGNESTYTTLSKIIEGSYLSDNTYGEALIGFGAWSRLGLKLGGNVTLEIPGTTVMETIVVKGLIRDEEYERLTDVDGSPLGPARLLQDGSVRRCNSSEIIVVNLETAKRIQEKINALYGGNAPQFVVPSEILFRLRDSEDEEAVVKSIIFFFNYDVFVSSKGVVKYYYIGSYIEFGGAAELLIPLVMVVLSIGMVMVNSVYEREREIKILSTLGLNPTHIGLMFVAEAIIMGMVGGSIGYLTGLGFYRALVFIGQNLIENLMVREKLEWWWSALGFVFAIAVSVFSAARPAALAISTYTPSMVKRVRRPEEERKEKIFKVYQARNVSMPVKILSNEKDFFTGFLIDHLNQLRTGYKERIENVEDTPEVANSKGVLTKTIRFNYYFGPVGSKNGTKNGLVLTKTPAEEHYRVRLVTEPTSPGIPENMIDRTVDYVHWILMLWVKEKKRIMGSA